MWAFDHFLYWTWGSQLHEVPLAIGSTISSVLEPCSASACPWGILRSGLFYLPPIELMGRMGVCELVSPRETQTGIYLHPTSGIHFPGTFCWRLCHLSKASFCCSVAIYVFNPRGKGRWISEVKAGFFQGSRRYPEKTCPGNKSLFFVSLWKSSPVLASACLWNLRSSQVSSCQWSVCCLYYDSSIKF